MVFIQIIRGETHSCMYVCMYAKKQYVRKKNACDITQPHVQFGIKMIELTSRQFDIKIVYVRGLIGFGSLIVFRV